MTMGRATMFSDEENAVEDDVEIAVGVVKRHRKKLDKMRRHLDKYIGEVDELLEYTGLSESNRNRLRDVLNEEQRTVDQVRETLLSLEGLPVLLREERPAPSS